MVRVVGQAECQTGALSLFFFPAPPKSWAIKTKQTGDYEPFFSRQVDGAEIHKKRQHQRYIIRIATLVMSRMTLEPVQLISFAATNLRLDCPRVPLRRFRFFFFLPCAGPYIASTEHNVSVTGSVSMSLHLICIRFSTLSTSYLIPTQYAAEGN